MSTVIQGQNISFGLGLWNDLKLRALSPDETFLETS